MRCGDRFVYAVGIVGGEILKDVADSFGQYSAHVALRLVERATRWCRDSYSYRLPPAWPLHKLIRFPPRLADRPVPMKGPTDDRALNERCVARRVVEARARMHVAGLAGGRLVKTGKCGGCTDGEHKLLRYCCAQGLDATRVFPVTNVPGTN